MVKYPKVKSVKAKDNLILEILFDNEVIKKYDCKKLLDDEMYLDLENEDIFKQVQVDCGGYAVAWNSEIDLCEAELWDNGVVEN